MKGFDNGLRLHLPTMHRSGLIALAFSLWFASAAGAQTYRFASGEVRATARHPFKVIQFTNKSISGQLSIDPQNRGSWISVSLSLAAFHAKEMQAQLYATRASRQKDEIKFYSRQMQMSRVRGDESRWEGKVHGELTAFGITAAQSFDLKCLEDHRFYTCTVKASLPLERFRVTPPTLLGVKGGSVVDIDGELTLAPEKES